MSMPWPIKHAKTGTMKLERKVVRKSVLARHRDDNYIDASAE